MPPSIFCHRCLGKFDDTEDGIINFSSSMFHRQLDDGKDDGAVSFSPMMFPSMSMGE
jgi:hypothetical protein